MASVSLLEHEARTERVRHRRTAVASEYRCPDPARRSRPQERRGALDDVAIGRIVGDRPTGEVDRGRGGVVNLEPLAVAVADDGRVAHHFADDDSGWRQR